MEKNGNSKSYSVGYLFTAMVIILFMMMAACDSGGGSGGGGGGGAGASQSSSVSGSAVKLAVSEAEVKIFYFDESFDENGNLIEIILIEIIADNAPVLTGPDGTYELLLPDDAEDFEGPWIVKTSGGEMGDPPAAAPTLAAVIAEPNAAEFKGNTRLSYLSTASSVAAGLLEKLARKSGAAPSTSDAEDVIRKVEEELGVDLSKHPGDRYESTAMFNECVDQNLDLIDTPQNSPAVNEFIDYLVANLSSTSGKLDGKMDDPDNPGEDIDGNFAPFGNGELGKLFPAGPSSWICLMCSADKDSIENDGLDFALLTCTVRDAFGDDLGTDPPHPADPNLVTYEITTGRGIISPSNWRLVEDGQTEVNLSGVWAGNLITEGSLPIDNGNIIRQYLMTNVTDEVEDVEDPVPPRIASAGAISNTEVLVTFSEAIRGGQDGAENSDIYRISTSLLPGTESILDALIVKEARLLLPDRTTVKLKTFSMADVEYLLTVLDVKDLAGNTFAPPDGDFKPNAITFTGIPPGKDELVDTDNDGVTDDVEQRGWIVTVSELDGTTRQVACNSDPRKKDTDGDGLDDIDEIVYHLNPRSADTDADNLTDRQELNEIYSDPLDQDTDGDELQDGLEFNLFKTSPILADTDGDQIPDNEEIPPSNRDPRISDLPRASVDVGAVNLQLDTRFSYTDTTGQSATEEKNSASTLTQAENQTFSTSDETANKATVEASSTLEAEVTFPKGGGVKASVTASAGLEKANTSSFGTESGESAEEAYHESLTTTQTVDASQSVTREVIGANMKVDVTLDNAGSIPFAISNLELTAQAQNPRNRRQFLPVASLVPENPDLDTVNLGTLGDTARGPFVFKAIEVFPKQIEDLMKNPRGLIVKLANFDITDEANRNFVFTSQEVLDRTAGVTIDFGNGDVETYRVATNSTFDEFGRPRGITMFYALNDILGLSKYSIIRDGGDGVVETRAAGDDVQVVPVGSWIEPGGVIIRVGPDGVLDTSPNNAPGSVLEDDRIVPADYETTEVMRDTDDDGTDDKPVDILTRVRNVATGAEDVDPNDGIDERESFWAVFSEQGIDPGIDFDNIVLHSGDQFTFTFVQDKDEDGVWAREEFLYGSSDLDKNTDDDGLDDQEEIQEGWIVQIKGSAIASRVYPNPVQADSDRDQVEDHNERSCGLDPRQRDTDLDGLTDYEELFGVLLVDDEEIPMDIRDPDTGIFQAVVPLYIGAVILDGGNGVVDTAAAGDDVQVAAFGSSVVPGSAVVSAGPNQVLDTTAAGDDFQAAAHEEFGSCTVDLAIAGFATDPLNPDTDGDRILDGAELELGINPNDPSDGPLFLDDDGDGVPNKTERDGFNTIINGIELRMRSNPNNTDSDDDGLPDLLEHFIASNPQDPDTDADGISDFNEYRGGGEACVTLTAGDPCVLFKNKLDRNYQQFLKECEDADVCDFDETTDLASSDQIGTNLNERDTDFDNVNDPVELEDFDITVNGATITLSPFSTPLNANPDGDGWKDGVERSRGTDPNNADTDADGTNDDIEAMRNRNPRNKDKRISLRYDLIDIVGDCERFLFGVSPGEFRWSLQWQTAQDLANGVGPFVKGAWNQENSNYLVRGSERIRFTESPVVFVAEFGAQFRLTGWLQELDSFGADGTLEWDQFYTVNQSLNSQFPVFFTSDPDGDCSNADWSVETSILVD